MDNFIKPENTIKEFGLQEGMKVADFGAGSGAFTIEAAKRVGPTGRVYAIEVQRDLLPRIKSDVSLAKLMNTEVIWGDIEKERGTKIADAVLDAVMMVNTFFILPEKDNCVKEVARVLKPGGKLYFIDWSDSFSSMGPIPEMVVRPEDVVARFERFGFDFKGNIINVGAHHYGIVLEKKNEK